MDPATAGMDILDAVNAKMMTESWERRAGIPRRYDPYTRALELLQETLDEDAFADMQARMAAQADQYLKSRDSSLSMADTSPGAAETPEEPEPTTELGKAAKALDEIRRLAIRDNYTIGREAIGRLGEIVQILQQADADMQKPSMGDRVAGMAQRAKSHFTKRREPASVRKARRQAQRQARRIQRRSLRSDIGEDIAEIRRRAGIMETDDVLRQVIPEIRGIALHYVSDANAKQRMTEIADQLASL